MSHMLKDLVMFHVEKRTHCMKLDLFYMAKNRLKQWVKIKKETDSV